MRVYIYYVPEFDTIITTHKKYKKFYRDAFKDGLKGMTELVYLSTEFFKDYRF